MNPIRVAGALALAGLLAALAIPSVPAAAQRPAPLTPGLLRVCADPENMPFSNQKGEGLENKVAELLARTWNSRLEYVWWAAPRGLSRMLNGQYCDVLIQAPAGYELAGVTRPYYRTGYVIVTRRDRGLDIRSLDDPRLKTLKIGVHVYANDAENSPPAMALSAHGVVGNLVGFGTVYLGGQDHPEDIVKAVVDGKVDLAIVWGPIAGYYAKQLGADLVLTPLEDDSVSGIPFQFSMGMATRRRERALRDSLQQFLDANGPALRAILQDFGVPLLPLPADTARRVGAATPAP
ncbi:MAG TPA: quinoprotein dehydrogenase-associated putative ABC transporter substrate-binding protein [Gemmatimonadales bacterium]|nr:quinoprotein dehydrogenase-associated putative ABC transporter substrate-binding protein [Gemmatimonadales bacterium]